MKKAARLILIFCLIASAGFPSAAAERRTAFADAERVPAFSIDAIPAYTGEPYAVINDNVPAFTDAEITGEAFETYSELDELGRCGTAYAKIGRETMPTEKRGAIGMTRPSGWRTVRYDNLIEGRYLYNRCHLIAYRLAGENANERNLITGTRYLNVTGMLPFEDMVGDYVNATGNHVLYRVTPIFEGTNLVASGVHMEAYSAEDGGEGVCFNVYAYNVQPGVIIDYATGDSRAVSASAVTIADKRGSVAPTYILNRNTKKFHYSDCVSVAAMSDKNKEPSHDSREHILALGYSPCGKCKP